MKTNTRLIVWFIVMICAVFCIALLKVRFNALPESIFIYLAQFASLPFSITAIVEVNNSEYIDRKQKAMWTFGFIMLTPITGLLYLTSERKKLLSN